MEEPQIENAAITNVEPLLEKNIYLVSPDFMAHFQSIMKKKELTDSYALKIDGPNPELLGLSLPREDLMDFSVLKDIHNIDIPDEELNSIIQDLWSPKLV